MANPYDEVVASLKTDRQGAAPGGANPYDGVLDDIQIEQQKRTRYVFEKALSVNPDAAAEAKKLANQTGLAPDVVARNLDEVRRKEQARMLDLARMAEASPVLARQLADPEFTKQAHDDIGTLTEINRTLTGTLGDIGVTTVKAAVGLPQSFVGIADLASGGLIGKGVEATGIRFKETQKILDQLYSPAQKAANKRVEAADGFFPTLEAMLNNPSTLAITVLESAPQMIGGAGVARGALGFGSKVATVGPTLPGLLIRKFGEKYAPVIAAAFGEGTLSAGATAEQFRGDNNDGLIGAKETLAAITSGTGTALFSLAGGAVSRRLGLEDIDTALVAKGVDTKTAGALKTGFVSALLKGGISEGVFEELPQSVQEQMWQNWATDKPIGTGVGKVAAQGVLSGFSMGGGYQAVARVSEHFASTYGANARADQLKAALETATQSKLRERNPEEFRNLMQRMAEGTEGAPAEVFVDAEVLNQLAPEILQQLPQNVRDQLPDALAANDVVGIPVGDVLTIAPGTELEQMLVDNARVGDPRAMTRTEAQQAGDQAQQYLATEAQRVIEQANDQQAMQDSADRVKQSLLDQLNTAGRFRNDVNEAYATWTTAFYTIMAGRLGLSPEEMAARYPLKIAAQSEQAGAQLEQGPTLADVQQRWTDAGIAHDVSEKKGVITLGRIVVPQGSRGAGRGSAAMQALIDYADRTGQRVELGASSQLGGDKARLIEFYERFGFKRKPRSAPANKPFKDTAMVREPQSLAQKVDQTETPEFKNWFGESKVVDTEGKPLVVYHGTNAHAYSPGESIEVFNTRPTSGRGGAFFTDSQQLAEQYGERVYNTYLSMQNPLVVYADGKGWTTISGKSRVGGGITDTARQESERDAKKMSDVFAELAELFDEPAETVTAKAKLAADATDLEGKTLGDLPGLDGESLETDVVVKAARRLGYDGVIFKNVQDSPTSDAGYERVLSDVFAVFNPTQIKSATGNRGTFDPNDPSILAQTANQTKARATFNPATLELVLNANANLSSYLHETGHFFLGVMADLANQPNAPTEIADDMNTLLAWFGVTGDENVGGPDTGGSSELGQSAEITPEDASAIIAGDQDIPDGWYVHGRARSMELTDNWPIQMTRNIDVADGYAGAKGSIWMIRPKPTSTVADFSDYSSPDLDRLIENLRTPFTGQKEAESGPVFDVIQSIADSNGTEPADVSFDVFEDNVRDNFTPAKIVDSAQGFDSDVYLNLLGFFGGEQGDAWPDFVHTPDGAVVVPGAKDNVDAISLTSLASPYHLAQGGEAANDQPFTPKRTPLETWMAMTLDQKRKYHERFAESMEQYLLEGKAPSVELQPLFRKFRAWMLNVYKSLKQFVGMHPESGIVLSDEIRQVFDRMVASAEQIAQAEESAGLLPDENATDDAIEKLTARSLRDLKWTVNARAKEIKKLQKQAAEMRKGVEAEVRAEVEAMPVYAAQLSMRGENKLDIGALAEMYAGEGDRYALLDWKPLVDRKLAGKTGVHPDILADSFGYASGDEMVRAVLAAEPMKSVIQGMTDQRMLERHGDLIDDRAIAEAANEAVHNEARARSLATELKSQADMLNRREDTGTENAAGNRVTVNVIAEAAKQFAANVIARTPLRDLKSRATQHVAAERRAGKRWQEATAAGKTQDAVKAKQDQVLNNAAAKAALEAQQEAKKIIEFFRRVVKDGNEKTVERGRDPDVVNAARAVLAAYGVAPRAGKSALEYMEIVQRNDPAMYAALNPSIQGALNSAQPLDALTMEELRGLNEEIQAMWHLAKRSRQMEVDGNLMDIEDAEDELKARMQEVGVPDTVPGQSGALTKREEAARKLQFAGSLLRRVESWAEAMDGKFGGPFLRLVFQPVKEAADRYRADRVAYRKAYQELIDKVAPYLKKGVIEAPELGYTFGRGHNGIGHAELLHAILHTGNDSNKRKLLLGREWATENPDGTLDTRRWDAFIERMQSAGTLTKEHYDFAQGVWDLLEQTKPLAQKTHRDVFGRYFAEVTANEFTTPFGTYRGGYVPAQADPRIVLDADMRKLAEAENENMAFSFPTTNKGFTQSRVDYNRPLMLDLRSIGQHLDKVLLFAHMEPAVRDVQKLLTRKGVSYQLGRIDPTIFAGMLTPWLNRSARQTVETPVVGDGGLNRILSVARNRAGMALMFANVSNTLQQLTGFSLAAVKVKPSHMMRATAQMISSPRKTSKAVSEASAFMANRMENEISAINDAMDQILLDPSLYEKSQAWAQKHAYFLQTAMAASMEPIIWTGAYNQALSEKMSEKDAVRFADNVIRTTQGSTLPEDVSRMETGPSYARAFTQFVGYFNMMANTNATALQQLAREVGLRKGAGKALGIVTLGFLAPIWVAEIIALAMRGGPKDEDDDGYLDDWLAAVFGIGTIKGTLAMVPFVGQLGNAAISRFNNNPADDRMSLSPAVSLLEATVGVPSDIYKAITDPDKLNARNAVRDVASAVSIVTGLPAYAIARPVGYLAGVEDDRINPTGPVDMARGIVTGTPSPQSK